jgi:hypothetical protein
MPAEAAKPPVVSAEDIKALKDAVATLSKKNEQLENLLAQVGTGQKSLEEKLGSLSNPPQASKNEKDPLDVDLEQLTNTQLADVLLKKISSNLSTELKKALGPLENRLTSTSNFVATKSFQEQIETTKKKHKDFDDWLPDIKTIAEKFPSASVEQLYQLARTEDPDKASELDTKYAEKPDESKKQQDPFSPFGGVFGSTPGDAGGDKSTKKTLDEAAEDSWDKIVGSQVA